MAPGIQDFSYLNIAHETVRGTPVAPTRQTYLESVGALDVDPNLAFHEAESVGRRSIVRRVTSQSRDIAIRARTAAGVDFDFMVWPLSQLKGGLTGVGGGADKTWTGAPGMTGFNNPESYTIDVGDDTQNYRLQYAMMSKWRQSAALGDLTAFEADIFAQDAVKVAKATPGTNAPPKIPGDTWQWKFAATFAGLGAAPVATNLVLSHKLEVLTGLLPRHYQDGTLLMAQHVETSIGGTMSLRVESTATAISEFYDKWLAGTIDYIRMKAQGPVLGGSFYSLQYDLAVLYSKVKPIDEQDKGINIYAVDMNLVDDLVNPPISPTLVCSLAALA